MIEAAEIIAELIKAGMLPAWLLTEDCIDMKPKFGDLQAKAAAEAQRRDQILFDRRVTGALRFLRLMPVLPQPRSPKSAFPETVIGYSIDVLEEASRQERERRAKELER